MNIITKEDISLSTPSLCPLSLDCPSVKPAEKNQNKGLRTLVPGRLKIALVLHFEISVTFGRGDVKAAGSELDARKVSSECVCSRLVNNCRVASLCSCFIPCF